MDIVHFGNFESTIKACGVDITESDDYWTHLEKNVTCKECLKRLHINKI